jgi:hypothetical protein
MLQGDPNQDFPRHTVKENAMKKLLLPLLFAFLSISTLGQQPDLIQPDAIKKLSWLVGQLKGQSWGEYGPGQRAYINMTETIQA